MHSMGCRQTNVLCILVFHNVNNHLKNTWNNAMCSPAWDSEICSLIHLRAQHDLAMGDGNGHLQNIFYHPLYICHM